MASIICKCGKRLTDFEAPNDIELRVYTDFEWDKLLEQDVVNTWEIPAPQRDVWRCSSCERIYVFKENKVIKIYSLEEELIE